MLFQDIIAVHLSKILGVEKKELLSFIDFPAKKEYGDLSFSCFFLSKKLKKSPEKIATELQKKIKGKEFEKIEALGPYLNFYFNPDFIVEKLFSEIIKTRIIPSVNLGNNKRVMIEFSQPNPNKPMHLGHLRNDFIGMSLSNMLSFVNYDVIKANLINDRGIHICQMMLAYKLFGENKTPESMSLKPDHFIGKFYVLFQKESKKNSELKKKAQELLKLWEEKDKETIMLWRKLRDYAVEGFKQTYSVIGSEFDTWFFESDFFDKGKDLINLGLKKKFFFKDKDNSIKVRLSSYNLPDKIVLRSDGTSIYFTNDLILTKHKFEKFKLDYSIWVVASEQNTYFKQLFKTLELLGFPWHNNCEHLSYGLVLLPEGKMKSREGKVIDADDLINELTEKAKNELLKRNELLKKNDDELKFRAEKIALSALKFFVLKHDLKKDFTFKPDKSLSFEGNTGPYLLYSYARAKSILRKVKPKEITLTKKLKYFKEEKRLLSLIALFNDYLKFSIEKRAVHLFADYLITLASEFNSFYNSTPVLKADEETRRNRLALVLLFSLFLRKGLELLNIDVLEKM